MRSGSAHCIHSAWTRFSHTKEKATLVRLQLPYAREHSAVVRLLLHLTIRQVCEKYTYRLRSNPFRLRLGNGQKNLLREYLSRPSFRTLPRLVAKNAPPADRNNFNDQERRA
jgi:hypothetical protein